MDVETFTVECVLGSQIGCRGNLCPLLVSSRALFSVGLLLTPRWFVDASLFRSAVSCCVADETVGEKEAALNSHGTENKQISKPFTVCPTHVNSCATESAQHTSHKYKGLCSQPVHGKARFHCGALFVAPGSPHQPSGLRQKNISFFKWPPLMITKRFYYLKLQLQHVVS